MPTPLLILSDAPTAGTGLGRITLDLATRIAQKMPETFRVATAGYAGIVSRHLPFQQYIFEGMDGFVTPTLPDIWRDWAGDEKGILLTIWDLSRLGWLTRPEMNCEIPILRDFLLAKPFRLWSYLPIDASGPQRKLTYPLAEALKGIDRPLAYGKWAAGVLDRTKGQEEGTAQFLPHGIDTTVFYERNRGLCRKMFISITQGCTILGNLGERITKDELLIGIVATNNSRKDFALGIQAIAFLMMTRKVRLWIKTDALERNWSIPALIVDYGLVDSTLITLGDMTDDQLAKAYSACDLTLGIGAEGYGYPIAESQACGTPCITGDYAGGAELIPPAQRINPIAFRHEGLFSHQRPVYNAADLAMGIMQFGDRRVTLDPQYDWNNLWPLWDKWLREGVHAP